MDGLAKSVNIKKGKTAIAEMIGVLFMSRTYAHMAHLKTPSFAKHMALNELYDGIVGLADSLAEAAQGKFGKLEIPIVAVKGNVEDPIRTIENHIDMLEKLGAGCGEPFLDNIFQEIQALYYSKLYKLRELA
jgi:hypothetical protein